ncbi:hypothetical protein KUV85_00725 [Nocardioides panacisoli]|uniref:hypothetical protein n=1 Tax=Nocardioides panacisoli TaxID=627624 RepID=UPI001C63923B|nr:hypothetical protein [Nocardioides panacisoli]QYJ04238.1 hypothetical protein KUV85_00725 [Nocardioides panacisoli]
MSTIAREHARVASLSRSRKPDDPELIEAKRNLRAARLKAYVRRVVDSAPPLTDDQRDEIASILRGASQ